MLNFLKKRSFGSDNFVPISKCKLCHQEITMDQECTKKYKICAACYSQAVSCSDTITLKLNEINERMEKTRGKAFYPGQANELNELLQMLMTFKERFEDCGLSLFKQDIDEFIAKVKENYSKSSAAEESQRKYKIKGTILAWAPVQWKQLRFTLKRALQDYIDLSKTMESVGLGFEDGRSLSTELLSTLMYFLTYLALADDDITELERQIITDYVGIGDASYVDVARRNMNSCPNFASDIPPCIHVIRKGDHVLAEGGESLATTSSVIEILKQFGIHFLYESGTDGNVEKATRIYNYIMNLNKYLDSYGLQTVSLDEFEEVDIASGSYAEESITAQPQDNLEELMRELNELIGLQRVKKDLNSLINLIKIQKIRKERGFSQPPLSLHLVFSGNPGTGKTTVARLLAQIYKELGLVSQGHLVEVDRSGLVAGYVGQTALKTQEAINNAKGGMLFIDEAYSLTENRGESDYGKEAIDTLVKGMEDYRTDLVVIVAGYPEPMDNFLDSNPGLRSRFNKFIEFDDYSPEELVLILKSMCRKASLKLSPESEEHAYSYFKDICNVRLDSFANARSARNFFEKMLVNQANRLSQIENLCDDTLSTIEYADVKNIAEELS